MFVVIVVLSACQPGNMPNMRGEHFVLTPSGGEPVTGNDLLGAAQRHACFRREPRSRNDDVEMRGRPLQKFIAHA